MLSLDIYPEKTLLNKKQIITIIISFLVALGIYLTSEWEIIILPVIVCAILVSIFEKRKPIGRIALNNDEIYLIKGEEGKVFKIKSVSGLSIIYIGYNGKRLKGDFLRKYDYFDGTDNHFGFIYDDQKYNFKFQVIDQEEEQKLVSVIERWKIQNIEFQLLTLNI